MAFDEISKTATLYRMVMPDHLCTFGLKSKDLLERKGHVVDDHQLTKRDETEAFKKQHGVEMNPNSNDKPQAAIMVTFLVCRLSTRSRSWRSLQPTECC